MFFSTPYGGGSGGLSIGQTAVNVLRVQIVNDRTGFVISLQNNSIPLTFIALDLGHTYEEINYLTTVGATGLVNSQN